MPADHLTLLPPGTLTDAVLRVLTGADLNTAAAALGVDRDDLADAVDTYAAGGQAALERRAGDDWYQVRIQFPDWDHAETTAATHLAPALDQLRDAGAISGWWFVRKHPCWRLRFHHADTTAVSRALDALTTAGTLTRWWPTVYEPETAAFGGPAGVGVAHDLFCADSHHALAYFGRSEPRVQRRELSLLLLGALLHAAGLDWFERGDVFARVAQLRPAPAGTDTARVDALAGTMRALLAVPADTHGPLFSPDGRAAFAADWLGGFITAGTRLRDAATSGALDRGLRTIAAHLVIFHWNRLGLSAVTQGVLAYAATTAFLPRDSPCP
jgi:thiopeptide-type bacteriocin biosynthesis protein